MRQRKREDRSTPISVRRAKSSAMRLDDGAADGEPYPHPGRLGRHKRSEEPDTDGARQAGAAICDMNRDHPVFSSRSYGEVAPILARHRFHRVAHQVKEDLLNLDLVDNGLGRVLGDPDLEPKARADAHERECARLLDSLGKDLDLAPGLALPHEVAQALDDVPRPLGLLGDPSQRGKPARLVAGSKEALGAAQIA